MHWIWDIIDNFYEVLIKERINWNSVIIWTEFFLDPLFDFCRRWN